MFRLKVGMQLRQIAFAPQFLGVAFVAPSVARPEEAKRTGRPMDGGNGLPLLEGPRERSSGATHEKP